MTVVYFAERYCRCKENNTWIADRLEKLNIFLMKGYLPSAVKEITSLTGMDQITASDMLEHEWRQRISDMSINSIVYVMLPGRQLMLDEKFPAAM